VNASTEHRRLAAIMFTDMVGYSALTPRDEALALDLLEEHREIIRGILPPFQWHRDQNDRRCVPSGISQRIGSGPVCY